MKKKNHLTAAAVAAAYIAAGIITVFAVMTIVSCATQKGKEQRELSNKGTLDKIPAPEWYTTYKRDGNIVAVEALPAFRDRYCFIGEQRGPDLEFCQAFARQFNVQSQIGEMVRTNVAGELKATQAGSSSGMENAIDNFVNGVLNVSFSGAQRTGDWWRSIREYDHDRKGAYEDYYEAYVFYTVPRNTLNQAVSQALETAASKDSVLYDITIALAKKILLGDYNLNATQGSPASVSTSAANTGKLSIFSRNDPSNFISMVKIFKGSEARGDPFLIDTNPIRPERKAEWNLPEGEYTVALYYNNSDKEWGHARVSVTAGDVFSSEINANWSSFSFKK
ncbi:MAG: hypothetical protein LBF83_02355 [Spirochaetaceae bacterium]|jgi:hypothetical protein|nr:hypothetical protein [Spirochaetaceae bacterium]